MDISGSDIIIDRIDIQGSYDKGLSIGENSTVNIKNADIKNSSVCIANKDGSNTKIVNLQLSNCEIGVAAFTKKSYYDISTIELNRVTHNNNKFKYLRDDINKIIVNRYLIDENEFIDNNIQSKIYE